MTQLSSRIRSGRNSFGLVKKDLQELKPYDFISFLYEAKTPGVSKVHNLDESLYDANPFLFLLRARRDNKTGKILVTGLNAHYLSFTTDKARVIASLRLNNRVNKRYYQKLIHTYRLDRIKSPLFKAVDVIADAYLLKSGADWTSVNDF